MNYILWLQDILNVTYMTKLSSENRLIKGLDIGTGASAIYPLLGCQSDPTWRFVATDIDEKSLEYARLNVRDNSLHDRITILRSDSAGPLLCHILDSMNADSLAQEVAFDFTMCNPPFYSSKEDVRRSAEAKEFQPNAVCTGADVEMITPGGEAAFVCTMVSESLASRTRCRWYTSMLGKLSSLTEVVVSLRENHIDNYAITEFVQGQTRRWAIAWSFGDVHLPDSIARISNPSVHSLMPTHNTVQQTYPQPISFDRLSAAVTSVLASIDGLSTRRLNLRAPQSETSAPTGADVLVEAAGDTWSRAARRRKLHEAVMRVDASSGVALVCRVACLIYGAAESKQTTSTASAMLQCHWVKGRDRGLFESFASHLSRKVVAALSAKGS